MEQVLAAANATADVLQDFNAFRKFKRNGIDVAMTSSHANDLEEATRDAIVAIFEANMKEMYQQSEWKYDPVAKKEELFEEEARYLLARDSSTSKLVGFIHFRFVEDDDVEVLYVYEIQVSSTAQRRGLGKFLMQLTLLIARRHKMKFVVLTVFKSNRQALDFYLRKMGFEIDTTSPSACGDHSATYEILSRAVDPTFK